MTTCALEGDIPSEFCTCPTNQMEDNDMNVTSTTWIEDLISDKGIENTDYEGGLYAWIENAPTYYTKETVEEWYNDFEEAFQGMFDSEQEFSDQLADDVITGELPEIAQLYFDYEKFARDLFIDDYWSSGSYGSTYVFRNI